MKTENEEFKQPALVGLCYTVGGFALAIGGLILVFTLIMAFSQPLPPDTGRVVAIAIALALSSLFWFAIGQVINSLAQIAHNTKSS